MTNTDSIFVPIHILASRFEADWLMGAFEKEGIPTMLRPFVETAYDGLFVIQKGWGQLMAPGERAEEARGFLRAMLEDLRREAVYENPAGVDSKLWEDLRLASPEEVARRTGARFDEASSRYIIPCLEEELLVSPSREVLDIRSAAPALSPDFFLVLATLHYLLEAKEVPPKGRWISEKDLPGGETFFRGPHSFPLESLSALFGRQPELFDKAAQSLGGAPSTDGDAAWILSPFPRMPVQFVFWRGDDEFEPDMHLRFDETVRLHFRALDTIWALGTVACRTLLRTGQNLADMADHER